MNRRTLLASIAIALTMPAVAHAESSAPRCGTASRTFEHPPFAGARHGSLRTEVRRQGGLVAPLPTADEILAQVIAAGRERVGLEFSVIAHDTPSPPELDLEAIFLTWASLEGAVAARHHGALAVLQEDGTRWTITIVEGETSAHVDLLETVALAVARRHTGACPDLLELLPAEYELPAGWKLATEQVTPTPCER